jgi:dipeptidyl aminopeptidase/acylaminoacyl peptidase
MRRVTLVVLIVLAPTTTVIAASGCGGASVSDASGPPAASTAVKDGPIVFRGATDATGTCGGCGNGLWAWKAGWKGLRHITAVPFDWDPQGSPDGRWIVFIRLGDVFRARTDGSRVVQVTSGSVYHYSPSFTRSGQRILFSRPESSSRRSSDETFTQGDIYSVKIDGTDLQQLTTGNVHDADPVMSPNGKIIAFVRSSVGRYPHVFTMRRNGTHIKDETPQRFRNWASEPAFSPSGRRIAFVTGHPGGSNSDIYSMSPDGRDARRLTGRSGDPLGGVSSPSWSPDGTRIVFQRVNRFNDAFLHIIRVIDRKFLAKLGGPRFNRPPLFDRSPYLRTPAWLER